MKWWKKALIGSIVWILLIVAGDLYMMQRIKREANGPAHRDAWETKLGEVTVYFFALGHAGIWYFIWRNRDQSGGSGGFTSAS